jgi:hypothetical protein
MSTLRAYNQTPLERKRYTVSYARWLDPTETLFDHAIIVSPSTDPGLIAEDAFSSNFDTEITFFLKGGVTGVIYDVRLIATTTEGQVKEDTIQMAVY